MIESSAIITLPPTTPHQSVSDALRVALVAVVRSPATWLFAGIWLVALTYLLVTRYTESLPINLAEEGIVLLIVILVVPLTRNAPSITTALPHRRPILWLQVALLGGIIVITGFYGVVFHRVLPSIHLPLWDIRLFLMLTNPLLYFVLPMLLLFFTGSRFREVGFGSGWHSWRVIVLFLGVGSLGILPFVTSLNQVAFLPVTFVVNMLQNGFSEEFLFRGALQTRLRWLLSPSWAVVVSSLVFGLWHIGAVTQVVGDNYFAVVAYTIVNQATMGLFLGIIFWRTRNLLTCSLIHAFLDSL